MSRHIYDVETVSCEKSRFFNKYTCLIQSSSIGYKEGMTDEEWDDYIKSWKTESVKTDSFRFHDVESVKHSVNMNGFKVNFKKGTTCRIFDNPRSEKTKMSTIECNNDITQIMQSIAIDYIADAL